MKQIARVPYHYVRKIPARYVIWRLSQQPYEVSSQLAKALSDTLKRRLTPEEAQPLSEIEAVRRVTNARQDTIRVIDNQADEAGTVSAEATLAPMTLGEISRMASKGPPWTHLLFHLIRQTNPTTCVEMGACVGISASYQATALRLNGAGTLTTIEGTPALADVTAQNLKELQLDNTSVVSGRFQDVLESTLQGLPPVDYIFIDGHHDEFATLEYFEMVTPFLSPQAVLVFDDIIWSDGMERAWKRLADNPRLKITINLRKMGIGIFNDEIPKIPTYFIPFL